MKNLFVMHTQYNLILSASVISRYKNDDNTLVLWCEFDLKKDMIDALEKLYDNVIVVSDKYTNIKKPISEINFIKDCLRKVDCLKKETFDRIYLSQERIFDLILCEGVKRKNPSAICVDIEEDAYYSLNNKYNDPNYIYSETARQKMRRFLYSLFLWRYPYNYKNSGYFYGMSEEYDEAELLFPDLARREMLGKKLNEITKCELLDGINSIYSAKKTEYPKKNKFMVIFFDLMNRYKKPQLIKNIMLKIFDLCKATGRTVLLKYHPREVNKFDEMEDVFEIDKLIPAEKVLYDLVGYDVCVLGNATTACIVAAKFNYNVISICKIDHNDNISMHNAMSRMGINLIDSPEDIQKIIF